MPFRGSWQPQYVQYNHGDAVEYQGQHYEIIQPHASQADWAPTVTPALWRHVDSSNYQNHEAHNRPPVYQAPSHSDNNQNYDGFATKPEGGYVAPSGQEVTKEESKKPWYDIRDDSKKQFLAAGGLALGLGLVGGAVYSHNKHEKEEEEERQAQAWELQNWVLGARKRSEDFLRDGPKGPVTWVLSDVFLEHPKMARDLVAAGEEDGRPWYIVRAPYNGTLQVGKGRLENNSALGYIGFGDESIEIKKFEVLIGGPNATEWVPTSGPVDRARIGGQPVVGGHDKDNSDIYVARINFKGAVHPGKASATLKGGLFCYGAKEKREENYEILCTKGR